MASGRLPHQNLERWSSLALPAKDWLSSRFHPHLLLADFATDRLRIQTEKSTTVSFQPRSSWLRASRSPPPALGWPASQCCSPTRPTPTLQSSSVLAPFSPSSPLPHPSSSTLSARSMLPSSTITRWANHLIFLQGLFVKISLKVEDKYTAVVYNLLLRPKKIEFKLDEVDVPEVSQTFDRYNSKI